MKNYPNIRSIKIKKEVDLSNPTQHLSGISDEYWIDITDGYIGEQYDKSIYEFNGTNSYIDTNQIAVSLVGEVSVFAKVQNSGCLISNRTSGNNYFEVDLGSVGSSLVEVHLKESPNNYTLNSQFINDGQWHHISVEYTGTELSIYVDYVLDSTISGLTNITSNSNNVLIGTNNNNGHVLEGYLSDFEWKDDQGNTLIHYKMEERQGTISYDASGLENHGTLHNILHTEVREPVLYNYTNEEGYNIDNGTIIPKVEGMVKVEDYPWNWITQNKYLLYKGNYFKPSNDGTILQGDQSDYDAVTIINLINQSLTTNFTEELLGKFTNLEDLFIDINNIDLIDISHNPNIVRAVLNSNGLSTIIFDNSVNSKLRNFNLAVNTLTGSIDLTGLTLLETFFMHYNSITSVTLPSAIGNKLSFMNVSFNQLTDLDLSNSPLLTTVYTQNNKLTAATNSQMLINLDGFGLSNGFFQGSIFGTGFITPTGIDSFNDLLSKSWNIIGLTNQINAGITYNIEDFPLIWIDDLYYNTYKDNTFVPSVDTLMTGQIEYDAVTLIDLAGQSLTTDFTNTLLSKFVGLEDIFIANNFISVLDVSNLTQVKQISCHGNSISVLDVTNLLNLTYIHCGGNSISVLDVTNLSNLTLLYCYSNPISVLDVSNLLNLTAIHCGNVPISVLDVTNLVNLTQLYCYGNYVSVLDVVNLIELNTLHIYYTQIDFLDFTNLTKLNNFDGFGARLNSTINSQLLIDLDGHGLSNGYFQSSIFGGGYLTPLGVESAISLNSKNWNIVGLTYVLQTGTSYDVEDFPLAWIEENNFATYSGNTFQVVSNRNMPTQTEYDAVTIIDLNGQSLTTDFTNTLLKKFSNLQELKVNNNSIQVLDPSQLYELATIDCHNNSIEVLDVSQLTELTTLYCYINQIEVLNTTNLVKLVNLVCYTNQIQVLDTSQLVDLLVIDCQYNQIQVLDISNSLDLNFLRCNNNQIQVLAISQLTKLTYIDCASNQIQSLDTSLLNLLTTFYCYNNLLTNLDISQNVNLVNLICYANQLDNLVNSQILIDLDANGLSNGYLNSTIFGGGSLTAAGQTAKANLQAKGWSILGI